VFHFLSRLLPKEEINKLMKSVMSNEVYSYNGTSEYFNELKNLPKFSSVTNFLDHWTGEVDVHLLDLKDEASTKKVSNHEAMSYYDQGMGLLFNDLNLFDEKMQDDLNRLCGDFGVSRATMSRNLVYATPKGGGTATHFDQNINLVLQLKGRKSWWLKENECVRNPLTRHTLGTISDLELSSYIDSPFPDSIKYDEEYELSEGSLLFVPKGHWHKTHAHDDSLALNFTFSLPSWVDILSMALRARLIQSEYWRDSVIGLNSETSAKEKLSLFETLLDSLKSDIQSWDAGEILSFIEFSEGKESNE